MYQYSWLVLFAPLLSFVVIVFGTRVWDMSTRPKKVKLVTHDSHGSHDEQQGSEQEAHAGAELAYATVPGMASTAADVVSKDRVGQAENHAADAHHANLDDSGEDDDEDPKVAHLSTGAVVSGYVGIGIMLLAAIYSWALLFVSVGDTAFQKAGGVQVFAYDWFRQGATVNYTVAFHLDTLSIAMMVVVTTVSLLVHYYSQGYMEDSAGYARFYAYLALFTFSMLVIVFAENFLVIFIGWELVGLSSYLLIGFWINKKAKPDEQRPAPSNAAVQAFVMNRIGDVGFIIGIMILFANTGTFTFSVLFTKAPQVMSQGLLATAMILVFCGAVGKSAQVPLHTWLPSAMEGPTPVSALIHAATMVAAGVYMVARTFPLFVAAGPVALLTVAWVGGITALFAATIALVQSDFKRVLAFSTISQLGYMFVGLGVSGLGTPEVYGTGPGMFHLFTHAFFKALLFLGAGSVLHSLHHATHKEVQDMRLMGGLGPKMPITAITWLIATLSISGFPFLSGFFSKETIIGLALQRGQWGLYLITLGTAGLTAFYMLRAFILAFGGPDGGLGGLWGGTYRGVGEPHEAPQTMTIPLIILAIPAVIAGYWFGFFPFVSRGAESLNFGELLTDPLTWVGVVVSLAGLVTAYFMYARLNPDRLHNFVENNATLRTIHRILYNRYYVDDLYNLIVKYGVLGLSHVEQAFDTYVVDGIVNGVARLVTSLGRDIRYTETGRVQSYMVTFFGGIAVLVAVVLIVAFTR
jgi:proton-translocating NADH-quinone oxidoreductase chain L